MCNRYTPARGIDLHRDVHGAPAVNFPPLPIGPFQAGVFVRPRGGRLEEVVGQWGMIRPGSPARREMMGKRPRMTNNARSETMNTLPTFRDAWAAGQRCLIPAWSFDEPNWETGRNVWWTMRRADGAAWGIAGLWSEWTDRKTGEVVANYTMPTLDAPDHPLMSRMHKPDADDPEKRSVVPLDVGQWDAWLDGTPDEALAALRLPHVDAFWAGPSEPLPPRGATPSLFR